MNSKNHSPNPPITTMVEAKNISLSHKLEQKPQKNILAEDFLKGTVPTNKDIENTIDNAIDSLSSSVDNRIAIDLKHLLSSSKMFIEHKNSEEQVQSFFRECGLLTGELSSFLEESASLARQGKLIDSSDQSMIENTKQLIESLKQVLLYWIESSEFRQLWTEDIAGLAQNLIGNIKEKGADLMEFGEATQRSFFVEQEDVNLVKERLNTLMSKLSHKKEYRQAIHNIFKILNQVKFVYDANFNLVQTDHLYQVLDQSKKVFSSFCGKDNFNSFIDSFWGLINELKRDKDLWGLWNRFQHYVEEILDHPEELTNKERLSSWVGEWYWMWNRKEFQFRDQFSTLTKEFNDMINAVKNDEDLFNLKRDFHQLMMDMFRNTEGRFDLSTMQHSLHQVKEVLHLILKSTLTNIPLPKIEGSNDTYDYTIENMTIDASAIMPSHAHVRMVNDIDIDSEKPGNDYIKAKVDLLLDNICMSFKDIHFHYKRHILPKVEDSGVANVDISGEGLQVRLRWNLVVREDQDINFELSNVRCKIDNLSVKILDSQHRILDGIITSVFVGYLKRMVADALVEKIKSGLKPLEEQLRSSLYTLQSEDKDIPVDRLQGKPKIAFDRNTHEYMGSNPLAERVPLLENEDSNLFVDKEARITTEEYHNPDFVSQIEVKDNKGASGAIYSGDIGTSIWDNESESLSDWDSHWWTP